ncbi:MAG: sodium/solute symporter [Verrucomicrobia bacterium]|jgi:SSS family transporter|nr:sodium/solute symporter [Verrucomicrobiota bacterium]
MISWIDPAIVAVYLAAIIGIGLYAGRRDKDDTDFFLGGRQMPWWAVLGSLIATEVSAATFLAVPGVGFSENFNYLQFGIGSIAARFFVAYVFVSIFYNSGCVTIYGYLGQRFGPYSQKAGSALFLVTRLLASGVRLLIAASGLSIILGIPLSVSIPGFCVLALIYTGLGGIRAVVWTDCIQALVFISAGIFAALFLLSEMGWTQIREAGEAAGRFDLFRWTPEAAGWTAWFSDANVLWLAVLFGFIQTTAALGTDQDLTQRLLTSRSAKQAQRSLILSGFIAVPIAALFLMLGTALFAYSHTPDGGVLSTLERSDQAFPTFIADLAPAGLRGLLLAGVLAAAMSSLDSAMAALSSSGIHDLVRPLQKKLKNNGSSLALSRWMTAAFAAILGLIAVILQQTGESFLWLAFQMSSLTYGALLGMFLLGLLTRTRGSDKGNLRGVAVSVALTTALLILIKTEVISLGWTWLIVIGTLCTFILGAFIQNRSTAS